MIKLKNLLIASMGVVILGCSTAAVEGRKATNREQIRCHSPWLDEYIEMKSLKMRRVGDILQANATLFSKYSRDLKLQYRFAWYDKDGFQVDPDSESWSSLNVHGYETFDVSGVAPNTLATEFKVEVREKED